MTCRFFTFLGAAALASATLNTIWIADAQAEFSGAKTLKVFCGSGDRSGADNRWFSSIQDALDRARPGDTVDVAAGTCRENVTMTTDKVTLATTAGAVIDGAGDPTAPTVLITARNVVVSGFDIENGLNGVRVGASGSATIADNEISGATSTGVVVGESSFARIVDNFRAGTDCTGISSAGATSDAILVSDSSSAWIEGNCVHDSEDGISVIEGSSVDAAANTIRGNSRSAFAYGSNSSVGFPRSRPGNTFEQDTALDLRCRSNGSLSVFAVQDFPEGSSNNDITTGAASSCTFFDPAGDPNIP